MANVTWLNGVYELSCGASEVHLLFNVNSIISNFEDEQYHTTEVFDAFVYDCTHPSSANPRYLYHTKFSVEATALRRAGI